MHLLLSSTCLVQLSWTHTISRQKTNSTRNDAFELGSLRIHRIPWGPTGGFLLHGTARPETRHRGRRRTHAEISRDGSRLGLSAGLETLEGAPKNAPSRSASANEVGDKLGSCCRYLQTQYWHFDLSLRCSDGSSLPNSFCFFPSCVDEWVRCVLARSLAAAGQPQCTTARFRCADRQLIKGTRAAKAARFPTGSMRTGCPRPLICAPRGSNRPVRRRAAGLAPSRLSNSRRRQSCRWLRGPTANRASGRSAGRCLREPRPGSRAGPTAPSAPHAILHRPLVATPRTSGRRTGPRPVARAASLVGSPGPLAGQRAGTGGGSVADRPDRTGGSPGFRSEKAEPRSDLACPPSVGSRPGLAPTKPPDSETPAAT